MDGSSAEHAGRWRIAQVTATFPPYLGGTGNVAYHNALELARRGHAVEVFTAAGAGPADDDPPGVRVHRLPAAFRIGNAPFIPGLTSALAGFDLVHLHYPFYCGGEQVWVSCRRSGRPYVVTYHQDVLFRWPLSLGVALHHRLIGARVLAGARRVIATTLDYAANSRLARLAPGRLAEVPNGVATDRFRPGLDVRPLRTRHALGEAEPVLLFVGRLDRAHYFKGIAVLLAALGRLPTGTLLVVGEGELRESYERQARAAGLGARVRFAGRVSSRELPDHYALADVVVLPSTTRGEAFGMVLIEAMASGKPVVASRLPGVRTVVDDGVNGLLVEPGDAGDLALKLQTVLSDRSLRWRLGLAGRRKVEARYDWRRIGARLESVYGDALQPPAAAPSRQRRPLGVGW